MESEKTIVVDENKKRQLEDSDDNYNKKIKKALLSHIKYVHLSMEYDSLCTQILDLENKRNSLGIDIDDVSEDIENEMKELNEKNINLENLINNYPNI